MSACPMRVNENADWERIEQRFHDLEQEAIAALQAEGFARSRADRAFGGHALPGPGA